MRTLKFRYWDTKNKKFDSDIGVYLIGGVDLANTIPEGYEITQFTGLKDRRGVEIYEEDIVRWFLKPHGTSEGLNPISEGLGLIEFNQDQCRLVIAVDDGWDGLDDAIYTEVIGNIWENPELLK